MHLSYFMSNAVKRDWLTDLKIFRVLLRHSLFLGENWRICCLKLHSFMDSWMLLMILSTLPCMLCPLTGHTSKSMPYCHSFMKNCWVVISQINISILLVMRNFKNICGRISCVFAISFTFLAIISSIFMNYMIYFGRWKMLFKHTY